MEIGLRRFYVEPRVHFLSFQRHCSINHGIDFPSQAIKHVWLDSMLN